MNVAPVTAYADPAATTVEEPVTDVVRPTVSLCPKGPTETPIRNPAHEPVAICRVPSAGSGVAFGVGVGVGFGAGACVGVAAGFDVGRLVGVLVDCPVDPGPSGRAVDDGSDDSVVGGEEAGAEGWPLAAVAGAEPPSGAIENVDAPAVCPEGWSVTEFVVDCGCGLGEGPPHAATRMPAIMRARTWRTWRPFGA